MSRPTKAQLQRELEILEARAMSLTSAMRELQRCGGLPSYLQLFVDSAMGEDNSYQYRLEVARTPEGE